jgi:hypothetical protein
MHDFMTSLKKSHSYENAPWWDKVYRMSFPGLATTYSVREDGWAQRGGIDRIIVLKSGKTITVDEKIREKDWGDILLERWSDEKRKSPGWIQKNLACDYIAYAFVPSQKCYLFPFLQLRKAWLTNGVEWIKKYNEVRAENKGYITVSIPIPIPELLLSVSQASIVNWS